MVLSRKISLGEFFTSCKYEFRMSTVTSKFREKGKLQNKVENLDMKKYTRVEEENKRKIRCLQISYSFTNFNII